MNQTLTQPMIFAAGRDAGNRSMREAGRTQWNAQDMRAAIQETDRLFRAARLVFVPEAA